MERRGKRAHIARMEEKIQSLERRLQSLEQKLQSLLERQLQSLIELIATEIAELVARISELELASESFVLPISDFAAKRRQAIDEPFIDSPPFYIKGKAFFRIFKYKAMFFMLKQYLY